MESESRRRSTRLYIIMAIWPKVGTPRLTFGRLGRNDTCAALDW
jgi:hypothetical protein